jgi:SAM-dependent methyltransferase
MDTVAATRWVEPQDYEALASRLQQKNAIALAAMIGARGGGREAIDLGCGTGFLAEQLMIQDVCSAVTCVDLSSDMLMTARTKASLQDQAFICSSLLDLEVGQPFDLVCSNAALHWLHPAYVEVFAKARALTREGGMFAFAMAGECAASRAFDSRIEAAFRQIGKPQDPTPFRERRVNVVSAERLCAAAGFVVQDAFLIDRNIRMAARDYAQWLIASGGPWGADVQRQGKVVEELISELAPAGGEVEIGHWSTVVLARAS